MKKNFATILFITALIISVTSCKDKAKEAITTVAEAVEETVNSEVYAVNNDVSTIEWKGFKPTGSHNGTIAIERGVLDVADGKVVGGSFIIDMNSITVTDPPADNKGNAKLTGHLKSADFFDVEKHPSAGFTVTGLEEVDGKMMLSGNLSLKEAKNNVTFPVTVTNENGKVIIQSKHPIGEGTFAGVKALAVDRDWAGKGTNKISTKAWFEPSLWAGDRCHFTIESVPEGYLIRTDQGGSTAYLDPGACNNNANLSFSKEKKYWDFVKPLVKDGQISFVDELVNGARYYIMPHDRASCGHEVLAVEHGSSRLVDASLKPLPTNVDPSQHVFQLESDNFGVGGKKRWTIECLNQPNQMRRWLSVRDTDNEQTACFINEQEYTNRRRFEITKQIMGVTLDNSFVIKSLQNSRYLRTDGNSNCRRKDSVQFMSSPTTTWKFIKANVPD